MRVIGIDPGTRGAVAVFDPSGAVRLSVYELPTVTILIGNKRRVRLDLDGCWSLILGLTAAVEPDMAFLEDVNGFGGNLAGNAAAAGVLMETKGVLLMGLVATQTPRHMVAPSVWTKALKIKGANKKERKAASRVAASQLFPAHADLFRRAKDDGVAEATLIAYFGATRILGYIP